MFARCIKRTPVLASIQFFGRVHCTSRLSVALLHSVGLKRIRFAGYTGHQGLRQDGMKEINAWRR
jgi:hypothetical protein